MRKIKCFDIVTLITDEATSRFSPLFKEDKEKKAVLKKYCDHLDAAADEFGAESCDVEVDEQTHKISITASYNDMITETGDRPTITLAFPSIWDKA